MSTSQVLSRLTVAEEQVEFHKPPALRPPRPDLHRLKTLSDPDLDTSTEDKDLSQSDEDLSLASRT